MRTARTAARGATNRPPCRSRARPPAGVRPREHGMDWDDARCLSFRALLARQGRAVAHGIRDQRLRLAGREQRRLPPERVRIADLGKRLPAQDSGPSEGPRAARCELVDGTTTRTILNAVGKLAQTVDQLGRTTAYAYDDQGQLVSTTYPDGTSTATTYDANGRRAASTDRAGRTTSFAYDALGRLTKTTYPDGSARSSTYDEVGRVRSSIDELGRATTYAYDALGRRSSVTDAAGNRTSFTYDAAGNQLAVTDPLGHSVQYAYDASNRQVKTIYPDGTLEQTQYDALWRVLSTPRCRPGNPPPRRRGREVRRVDGRRIISPIATSCSRAPAWRGGPPIVQVPAGMVLGLPVGISFIGTAFSEPTLIKFAAGFEAQTRARTVPTFAPSLPVDRFERNPAAPERRAPERDFSERDEGQEMHHL
jgi:YD repeat-containing protein